MIILQLSHGLALISSCTDRREVIYEKEFSSSRFNLLFLRKTLQSNLPWLRRTFLSSTTLKERPSGGRSSFTSESESKMCREDLSMRQRPVKSSGLRLTCSSSFELEESSLEKSRSLKATHVQDIIFWTSSSSYCPRSGTSSCRRPCCSCSVWYTRTCWRSQAFFSWGSR
jgi:hypothetical protein